MNTEIKSDKGNLPEANSQLNGMWEEVVRRYNIYDELVAALAALVVEVNTAEPWADDIMDNARNVLRKAMNKFN